MATSTAKAKDGGVDGEIEEEIADETLASMQNPSPAKTLAPNHGPESDLPAQPVVEEEIIDAIDAKGDADKDQIMRQQKEALRIAELRKLSEEPACEVEEEEGAAAVVVPEIGSRSHADGSLQAVSKGKGSGGRGVVRDDDVAEELEEKIVMFDLPHEEDDDGDARGDGNRRAGAGSKRAVEVFDDEIIDEVEIPEAALRPSNRGRGAHGSKDDESDDDDEDDESTSQGSSTDDDETDSDTDSDSETEPSNAKAGASKSAPARGSGSGSAHKKNDAASHKSGKHIASNHGVGGDKKKGQVDQGNEEEKKLGGSLPHRKHTPRQAASGKMVSDMSTQMDEDEEDDDQDETDENRGNAGMKEESSAEASKGKAGVSTETK
eukprot:TRINITY_DN10877_c0_g1_i1.p1 TRINITY_DN10877_c0_g1~~TRINITY_DN10877_c0_g1_i1.p1  ORF type:complete len:378 (+),score=130.67 TRINITY_DN10877_c0_g1_i1:61-1194(+)